MKITVAQLNPVVGDIDGNLSSMIKTIDLAQGYHSDLIVFPELFLTAYPPRDLLEYQWFIDRVEQSVEKLLQYSKRVQMGILFGAPSRFKTSRGKGLHNTAYLIHRGKLLHMHHKSLLPTYDVFDEIRYFDPAEEIFPIRYSDETIGITVCEDAWNDPSFWPGRIPYSIDPVGILAKKGASLFINISASPFHTGKQETRFHILQNHARHHRIPFLYVNQVGANDELIFDGRSMLLDKNGELLAELPSFEEAVVTLDTAQNHHHQFIPLDEIVTVYDALILGIRDYVRKCGFSKVVVGLSGGIDSAVTVCLATHALGAENVLGVSMPSPYSSKGSIEDSKILTKNLNIPLTIIPISQIYQSYQDALNNPFANYPTDITEENIQARIRGNILMAISNKFGYLVLSTGNKSELAVGYCTLYGDMSGGLAVISDIPKTMVYQLAHYINRNGEIIPETILTKAPSAELKPNQKDEDTLPPYEILDRILHLMIEEGRSIDEVVSMHYDRETVNWIANAIARNEYKRKQAAPGLKVTSKAFGIGRRMPIAARYSWA